MTLCMFTSPPLMLHYIRVLSLPMQQGRCQSYKGCHRGWAEAAKGQDDAQICLALKVSSETGYKRRERQLASTHAEWLSEAVTATPSLDGCFICRACKLLNEGRIRVRRLALLAGPVSSALGHSDRRTHTQCVWGVKRLLAFTGFMSALALQLQVELVSISEFAVVAIDYFCFYYKHP